MADNPQVTRALVNPVAEVIIPAAPQAGALPADAPAANAENLEVKFLFVFPLPFFTLSW